MTLFSHTFVKFETVVKQPNMGLPQQQNISQKGFAPAAKIAGAEAERKSSFKQLFYNLLTRDFVTQYWSPFHEEAAALLDRLL